MPTIFYGKYRICPSLFEEQGLGGRPGLGPSPDALKPIIAQAVSIPVSDQLLVVEPGDKFNPSIERPMRVVHNWLGPPVTINVYHAFKNRFTAYPITVPEAS